MAEKKKTSKAPEEKLNWKQSAVVYLHDLIYNLIIIMIIFLILFRVVIVSGTSMNMTLLNGDYLLLLSNIFYHNPDQGDIVVISKKSFDNGTPIVKRVIATEGQTVDIDFEEGIVYVDGEALEEYYTNTPTNTNGGVQFPLTVNEGCVFVMGDDRNGSRDSRYLEIDQIDKREILGKALFLIVPGTNTENNPQPRDYGRIGVVK